MKVDVESLGSFQRKIHFSIPANTVNRELDDAFRSLKGRVRIRGFRPGKAPRKVLEARFGSQVRLDVAQNLIQTSWTSAINDHGIEPVSRPSVDRSAELSSGEDFEFTITVDVRPTVTLDVYRDVEVVYPTVEVTDDEVAVRVNARLESQTRLVAVERPVERGDMVMVEFTAKDGDDEVARELGTMVRTEADPYYPGLEEFLVGLSAEETKSGTVTFADSAKAEAVAGRELTVEAKVINVQANEIPELDDEVAEQLGFEGGAEAMRASVRMQIEEQRNEMARNQARANLLQVLIEKNEFSVPAGMVDQQLEVLVEELKMQQAYRGVDPRSVHFNDAQMADLRMRAEFAVKGGLILDSVSSTESLEVTDADLERKYQELADERGQTIEAIRGYFVKEDAVEELRSRLLEEVTLDWLLEHATLVAPEEPVEAEAEAAPAAEAAEE